MDKNTVVFDFDGVIHSYISGWKGAGIIPDPPVAGIKEAIKKLRENGYEVVVQSTRCSGELGIKAVEKYLDDHGIEVDGLTDEKVPAICYVDDRAICFNGKPDTLYDIIKEFKTWQERPVFGSFVCGDTTEEIYSAIKKLPADIYLELYHKMQVEIGYCSVPAYPVYNSGCV